MGSSHGVISKATSRAAGAGLDWAAVEQLNDGHNIALLTKLKDRDLPLAYAQHAIQHRRSRAVLVMQLETKAHERLRQAVPNFSSSLPAPQSDLARETLRLSSDRGQRTSDDRVREPVGMVPV